ncbi:hypothetical protein ACC702_38565, partial [Rhizobium ruizarguesonis]
MKNFMNTAETMVAESVEGFVRAHEALVVFGPERRCIHRRHLTAGKVALISGGIQHAVADEADMHRLMAGAAA